MSYLGIQQQGSGKAGSTDDSVGNQALRYVSQNQDKIVEAGQFLVDNRSKVFQNVSNGQRFYEKNWKKNPKPIRYLTPGEYHIPLMSYCGPGTNLTTYRNFPPYNEVDNVCRNHDLAFEKAFKMPLGSAERRIAIREADKKAVKDLDKFPNTYGQRLARTSIALKQRVEDIDPSIIVNIMGEAYVGAEKAIVENEQEKRKEKLRQKGGFDTAINLPLEAVPLIFAPLTAAALYGEYRLAKFLGSKLTQSQQTDDSN